MLSIPQINSASHSFIISYSHNWRSLIFRGTPRVRSGWTATVIGTGLHDEAIPLLAQIMGILDVFDALTTERPYKAAPSFRAGG